MNDEKITIRNLHEYNALSRILYYVKHPSGNEGSLGFLSKEYSIKSENFYVLQEMIKLEKMIQQTKRASLLKRHVLDDKLVKMLIHYLNYFGIKFEESETGIRVLDEDHCGKYEEHNVYIDYFKDNILICELCGNYVIEINDDLTKVDLSRKCKECKKKEEQEKFVPII